MRANLRKHRWHLVLPFWVVLLIPVPAQTRGDDGPLSLADLPSYQRALESSPDLASQPVTFRDLWNRPTEYLDKRVQVEGTVERVFHQPSIGQLPALAEAWIVADASNPICLVFPDAEVAIGSRVRFSGDYLKRLRYGGGDTQRLAPLIVGPRAPVLISKTSTRPQVAGEAKQGLEWVMTGLVLMLIAGGFLRVMLRRPRRAPRLDVEPDPVFLDGPRPV